MKVLEIIDLIKSDFGKIRYYSFDLTGNYLDSIILSPHDTPKEFYDLEIDHIVLAYHFEIALKYNGYFDHYNIGLKND